MFANAVTKLAGPLAEEMFERRIARLDDTRVRQLLRLVERYNLSLKDDQ